MRVARRLLISGRVQGVGFRYFTGEVAAREGVTGWVRNLPDGRVEAYVEGEAEAVTRVERALGQGPRGARVEAVDVETEEPGGGYLDFTIR
ncbi:MAG: acylphosphatase [Acidobacteria bacterium RIFCSPLOWO2_02_FULL_68_18]|nr:MAG: acylphosphatase [Acidobacteria bacterium RIFCSPLOWO2_02_FULL_68_18]OFW50183.1 MAG: acylphosphatase [Acidobacteria bacterium RIFCSPLOWO2_12_FULL_68_19]